MVLEEPRSKNVYIYVYKDERQRGERQKWRQKEDAEASRKGEKESIQQDERVRLKEGWSARMVSRRSLAVWHPYSANYYYTALVGLHEVALPNRRR